jgi:hypothetical protein
LGVAEGHAPRELPLTPPDKVDEIPVWRHRYTNQPVSRLGSNDLHVAVGRGRRIHRLSLLPRAGRATYLPSGEIAGRSAFPLSSTA